MKKLEYCKDYLLKSSISEQVKREIINYCDDKTEHSVYLVTFEDVFYYVMNRIIKHENSNEIMKILEAEISDTICQCFTGRVTRLVNVLNGYYDDINIKIGTNEQISNIIVAMMSKYEGEELVEKIRKELEEREYDEETIIEWLSYV